MQVFAPYISFENWLSRGLVLEVVMQERMLMVHVRSVLMHLRRGYTESHGSMEEALASNFELFRLRFYSHMGASGQIMFFLKYSQD